MYEKGGKTFALVTPADFFEKAFWEYQRLGNMSPQDLPYYLYQVTTCLSDIWHLTDWVFNALPDAERGQYEGPKAFRDAISKADRALAICREIADAHKHFRLDRKTGRAISTGFILGPGAFRDRETTWLIADGNDLHDPRLIAQNGLVYWAGYLSKRGMHYKTSAEQIYSEGNALL